MDVIAQARPKKAAKMNIMNVHSPKYCANPVAARNLSFSATVASCMASTSDALHKKIMMFAVDKPPNA